MALSDAWTNVGHAHLQLSNGTRIQLSWSDALPFLAGALNDIGSEQRPSVFQSLAWLEHWMTHCSGNEKPLFIAGRDGDGTIVFLWPMSIGRIAGVRLLQWFGQSHFAQNAGYFRPEMATSFTQSDLQAIFDCLRAQGLCIDGVDLRNQPECINGHHNPLLKLAHQRAPNANYERNLDRDFNALYSSTFNRRARRNHSRQKRRLHELGDVVISAATTPQERKDILEAFLALKSTQLRTAGLHNPFERRALKEFYQHLLLSGLTQSASDQIEARFYGVWLDGRIIATLIGVVDGDRFTTLMSAITMDVAAKAAPGQALLEYLIRELCQLGIARFDFGPGASTQKLRWRMCPVPLFHTFIPLSVRAQPVILILRAQNYLLRRIKNAPRTFSFVMALRKKMAGA